MSRLRRQISANTANTAETKDLNVIKSKTGNVYESIAIIAKRANQINSEIKKELLAGFGALYHSAGQHGHPGQEAVSSSLQEFLGKICRPVLRAGFPAVCDYILQTLLSH